MRKERNLKKIILKSVLLIAPFVSFMAIEVFVLPLDFFSFRAWEALIAHEYVFFPGNFYPNQRLVSWSAGDHDPRGPRTRLIDFYTDKHGYRNRPRTVEPERYKIVLVGDSLIAGSHLKQHETIAEVLEEKCNCNTYSYAGGGTQDLLKIMSDPRFMEPKRRPRYVVWESRKGDMYNMKTRYPIIENIELDRAAEKNPSYWRFAWDRFQKHMALHSLQARLRLTMVASDRPAVNPPVEEIIDNTRKAVHSYNKFFADRGIQLIYFVMPSEDRNFDKLFVELDESGIPTISYLPEPGLPHGYEPANYYFKEDGHWRPESVEQAADKIMQKIRALETRTGRISKN